MIEYWVANIEDLRITVVDKYSWKELCLRFLNCGARPNGERDIATREGEFIEKSKTKVYLKIYKDGTGLEPVTKQATVRYLYHSATAATHFCLNGYVNKQNCPIWSEANPQVYVETPLHPEKLTVWCALWAGGILLQKRWP
ncbi:hypothetical protein TNCV_4905841 [Trichonephila clavipes]|uniref:Uncharacterized protein n=1 Tax=Trichonephila clavipes TaxID=2585209 RepID=A0A8X6V3I8_TRICX|nr:hypothetical protein TNCV_4905841 [Trichonephila clavipes]